MPPYSYTADESQLGSSANLVVGRLSGTDESEHYYFLSHRHGLVVEVLPSPIVTSGEMRNAFWHGQPGDESWSPSRVPRAADLNLVGRMLFTAG